jgi:cell division protein FtsI/penicillin-binding protein 2
MRAQRKEKKAGGYHLWIALLFLAWMGAIIWRLAHLQITCHEKYRARAEAQRQQTIGVSPLRGAILDRRRWELARSVDADSVFAYAREVKDPAEVARRLAPLVGEREGELVRKLGGANNFVWLKRKLNFETAQRLVGELERGQVDGVHLVKEPQRFYPNGPLAAHLLGQVDIDEQGIAGLEFTYDRYLRGLPGRIWLETDGRRRPYDRGEHPMTSGAELVLTLDAALQDKVESFLEEAVRGSAARGASAIVLDPGTGEILALANAPGFDPNQRPQRRGDAGEERIRRNRAITDIYEPGSVFKLVTYSAALEEGLARPDEKIDCFNGQIVLAGRAIRDTHAYGLLTVAEALAKSSNGGAIRLALRVGEERLADYIARFGFGLRTGVDLPGETGGVIHPVRAWRPNSIGYIAIGHEVGITALQAVAAMAAIANRGVWVQPHLVKRVTGPDGRLLYEAQPKTRRVVSEQTALQMIGMLGGVVTHGTARRAMQLAGYDAAGKTGTAQKIDPATRRYSQTKFVASFAGFVPATHPRFAIIVTLDEPAGLHQGGQVAAPVFNRIAETALGDYAVPPHPEAYRQAIASLQQRYGAPASSGESGGKSDKLIAAASGKDETATANQLVMPPLKVEPGLMPDFHGQGLRAVVRACASLDVELRVAGSGLAARQMPAPGTRVKPGEVCRVEFQ